MMDNTYNHYITKFLSGDTAYEVRITHEQPFSVFLLTDDHPVTNAHPSHIALATGFRSCIPPDRVWKILGWNYHNRYI